MSGILQADTIRPDTELTVDGDITITGDLSLGSLVDLETIIQGIIEKNQNNVPVGTIIPFGGPVSAIPDGWIICDGESYNRSENQELYDVIGETWGYIDGSSFNVPDLRGQFLRGIDFNRTNESDREYNDPGTEIGAADEDKRTDKAGNEVGSAVGSYQNDDFNEHYHTQSTRHVTWSTAADWNGVGWSGTNHVVSNAGNYADAFNPNTKSMGGSETRPKNAAVVYIIKAK